MKQFLKRFAAVAAALAICSAFTCLCVFGTYEGTTEIPDYVFVYTPTEQSIFYPYSEEEALNQYRSTVAQTGYCTVVGEWLAYHLWSEDFQDPDNMAIFAAESLVLYLYGIGAFDNSNIANNPYTGQHHYFSGIASETVGGHTYYLAGSGYISDDARHMRCAYSAQPQNGYDGYSKTFTADANDTGAWGSGYKAFPGSSYGVGGGWYISYARTYGDAFPGQTALDCALNGDPFGSPGYNTICAYSVAGCNSLGWTSSDNVAICPFGSGSLTDLTSFIDSLDLPADDPVEGVQAVHDALVQNYNTTIVNNNWIEVNYILDPSEDPTEETTEDYTQDATVPVYEPFTLPPEWVEEYTETIPTESWPEVTEVEPPTVELMEHAQALNFWRDLWNYLVVETNIGGYITVILAMSAVEFVLWHIGGGDLK